MQPINLFLCFLFCFILASCKHIPGSGPQGTLFEKEADIYLLALEEEFSFVLVDMDADAAQKLKNKPPKALPKSLTSYKPRADLRVKKGDVLGISVFESHRGGAFIHEDAMLPHGNFVEIPSQQIGVDGTIKIPYVGRVKAHNKYVFDIAEDIEKQLQTKALEPQVVISIKDRPSDKITVTGQVQVAGRFDIPANGLRILEAIALAEGADAPAYHVKLTLQRGKTTQSIYMSQAIKDPKDNIYLKPGDIISVETQKRRFSVLGATTVQARYEFESEKTSVQDGLAQAHGIFDTTGDPKSVVLYRVEDRAMLEEIGVQFKDPKFKRQKIPTVYRFNLQDPKGFFLAGEVPLENGDLIFIANALLNDLKKLNFHIRDPFYSQAAASDAIFYTVRARNAVARLPGYE